MATENLSLDKIRTNANQPRRTFYQESLEELAGSIKERGVLQPIVVRPLSGKDKGHYEIVLGERRFRACKMLGLATIPALVRDLSDEEAATDALLENYQREDMNVIEKARAIQGLLQHLSYEKIAKTLGVSDTTIRRMLELLELPLPIQQELIQNPAKNAPFQEGHARALLGINDEPPTQLRLLEKIKTEKLNISDTEKIIGAIRQFPQKKEAFLRVSVGVTEQMLRSLGAREERKKPYKSQTAEQHLKSIEKQASLLGDMLDDRIGEFLTAEHMNQLLATTAELQRDLESFNTRIRDSLATKDFGFREVYIHCPLCGRVELIGSVRCSVCWTILRRCYDCGNYDRGAEKCSVTGAKVFVHEAENPKEHSKSYRCPMYKPKFDSQMTRLRMAI